MNTLGWIGSKHGVEFFVPDSWRWQWLASGGAIHTEFTASGEVPHPAPTASVKQYIERAPPPTVTSTLLGSIETAEEAPYRRGRKR